MARRLAHTTGRIVGSSDWSNTRIRRQGKMGYQNIRMKAFVRNISLYLVITFVFLMAYVWTRVKVTEVGYRIHHQEAVRDQLKEERRTLLTEAATFRSPQRLEKLSEEFHMRRPVQSQVFFVKTEAKR